jgi:hypothetical protein
VKGSATASTLTVVRSPEATMPAVHQDSWWRPESDIPLTEPRWVKMVEIRPTNFKARKIVQRRRISG